MFNIAGFHIPKQIAFKHGAAILDKLAWQHPALKPLGQEIHQLEISFIYLIIFVPFDDFLGHDKRLYTKLLNEEDVEKQESYLDCDREEYLGGNLTNEVKTVDYLFRFYSGGFDTLRCEAVGNDGGRDGGDKGKL